ncbi:hypothetical protein [Nitratireductor soli]|nr:hypothetical protein [Nitratireductor soli]
MKPDILDTAINLLDLIIAVIFCATMGFWLLVIVAGLASSGGGA